MAIHKITIVLEDSDLDGKSMKQNASTKVESNFLLENSRITKEVANISRLCFRQTHNSNCNMLLTGYEQDNEWYGDRPDDGIWANPFTNKQYKRTGTDDVEYTAPTPSTPDPDPEPEPENTYPEYFLRVRLSDTGIIFDEKSGDISASDIVYIENVYVNDVLIQKDQVLEGTEITSSNTLNTRPESLTVKMDIVAANGTDKGKTFELKKFSEKGGVTTYIFEMENSYLNAYVDDRYRN